MQSAIVAVSENGSLVAVGTGSGQTNGSIILYGDHGNTLWVRSTSYIISSISMLANGSLIAAGGYQELGIAGAYANGAVFVFNQAGKELWNTTTGSSEPVWKVQLSSDGSKLVVETESGLLYLRAAASGSIWNYGWRFNSTANLLGMDMTASGRYIAVSLYYPDTPIWYERNGIPPYSFVAFDGEGKVLWNYTTDDGGAPGDVAVSSSTNYTWTGSSFSATNGSLHLFNQSGKIQWTQQIFSPALTIQTAKASPNALVFTNAGYLLYSGDGDLLRNLTSNSETASTANGTCGQPSFVASTPDFTTFLVLDGSGNTLLAKQLTVGVHVLYATMSPDMQYAVVEVSQRSGPSILYLLVTTGC